MSAQAKRAILVVAHQGYREEELDGPRRLLERAGVEVRLAASSLSPCKGMHGGSCTPDLLYSAVLVRDLDALVFVGGEGASEYFDDRTAHRLAREVVDAEKLLGSICFAGSTLANAGVLEGRRATCYPTREPHLRERGAMTTGEAVTVSGTIVTGRGPEDARAFAEALVAALSG